MQHSEKGFNRIFLLPVHPDRRQDGRYHRNRFDWKENGPEGRRPLQKGTIFLFLYVDVQDVCANVDVRK